MKWWEEKKHIFAREKLRLNIEWKSNDFEFFICKELLWLSGTLYLPTKAGGSINFPFELKYPQNYPFSVPYIYPKGREKNWVGNHQFIGTAFCLDVRDKTWNSSLSAVNIIKSLERLLLATLNMIENKTGTLDVYEEPEPTKLDNTKGTIRCIVPYPLPLPKDSTIGNFHYFSPMEDNRIIVNPILPEEKSGSDYIKKIIESEYLKIWGLNLLFSKSIGVWIKASQGHLNSIVFREDLNTFKEFLKNEKILSVVDTQSYFEKDKAEQVVFITDDKAELYAKINYKEGKVEYFGCYNPDLTKLNSRAPDSQKTSLINKKKVAIIGCGSSGSVVAEEFVKSGVSELILIDDDDLTVENVIRHTCSLEDIGLKKTQALKNKLNRINPFIKVDCINTKIITIPSHISEKIKNADVIVNATADIEEVINEFCWLYKIPSLHSKVYPMGYGGEIIRVIPEITPCFECMNNKLSNILETQVGFNDTPNSKFINYNETEEGEILPTPALSIDAKFISLFTVKMALDILLADSLEAFKSKPNIILWGNEKKWIFKEKFECVKVDTSSFISYSNCFVCFGNKQIETELGLTEQEILNITNDSILKNDED
ncbi:ThiF family adenylyltransferase [Labilibaculum euxinus]